MDNRPVVWEASNRRHILEEHPERQVTHDEIDEALDDPQRIESDDVRDQVVYRTVIGITRAGRLLVVVWVDHPRGRFPVHARQAGRRAARRYYR